MSSLFYDLHVCESQLEPQTQRERVALALKLGYDGVALVHQAKATLTEQDRCNCLHKERAGKLPSPACKSRVISVPAAVVLFWPTFAAGPVSQLPLCRCSIRPTELAALLSASHGVGQAMEASRAKHSRRGNAYTFRQLTRLNFPADDVSTAQACDVHFASEMFSCQIPVWIPGRLRWRQPSTASPSLHHCRL
jgi:hypothetical protein